MSTFTHIVLVIAFSGLIVYMLMSLPMPEPFRRALYIVAVVGLIIFLGYELNLLTSLPAHLR